MSYTKEHPTMTRTEIDRLPAFELHTLSAVPVFATGDPEGTPPVEPVRLYHEALMIYEDAKGKLTIDPERELEHLQAKFTALHDARALPAGVVKVKLLSLTKGIVNAAHSFVKDGPVEFFVRMNENDYRRLPI